jgi:5-deoxy-5-amino-3-dehydroquinate synthase
MIRVKVPLAHHPYEVIVGRGARAAVGELLPPSCRRVAVVTQLAVPVELDLPCESVNVVVPDGEGAKRLQTVEEVCRAFARAGLTRADAVVGLGGGVVTDLAGFAASTYHRGVAVIHVPTTLLAQVDAAIGGKTGVNLPEGKNLVGSFWQPAGVCCDTETLDSLPEREWRSGRGEMIKYAFLGLGDLGGLGTDEQVARCVALKAAVVAADERDAGLRMTLNYGHTLAHALEAAGFAESGGPGELLHGEAVAIGLIFAARLAERLGRIGPARVEEHLRLVREQGLPTALPAGADAATLVGLMAHDKKATEGLTFVLDGAAGVEPVVAVAPEEVFAALEQMEVSEQ